MSIRNRIAVVVCAAVAGLVGVPAPAGAAAGGPVSATPASGTPQLASTGTTQQVRQIVQCGATMYAVGNFTKISQGGTTYTRSHAFSFKATAPYTVTGWNPNVSGGSSKVNTIALSADCSHAYLGGNFSAVHGTAAKDLAEVATTTGAVTPTFAHSAGGQVETLLLHGSHLLTGGYFSGVNGSGKKFYVSLSPTTGKDDNYLNLNISGNYQFPGVSGNPTRVYNQQLSHSGSLLLVEGDFTSVGGKARQQIFMLSLGASSATVTGWTSSEFSQPCATVEPFYLQAASWSPTDAQVNIATTGYKPYNVSASAPRSGLCDAAAAFPATQTAVSHKWINYTGCDSLYSTAADANDVYVGGHERWASNPRGCDAKGPGAVDASGMVGLSPSSGSVVFNPTRGRGLGADDMELTSAGLWIASDNLDNTNQCGGRSGHAGICFLPY
jgi:hypothetical protein